MFSHYELLEQSDTQRASEQVTERTSAWMKTRARARERSGPENLWFWWWSWVLVVQHHPGPLVHFNIISCWFFLLPLPFSAFIFCRFSFLCKNDPKNWMPLYVIFLLLQWFTHPPSSPSLSSSPRINCVRFDAIESHSKMLKHSTQIAWSVPKLALTLFIYSNSTRNSIKTGLRAHTRQKNIIN